MAEIGRAVGNDATPRAYSVEADVLRAVPCGEHVVYVTECPSCLTGEQAAARRDPRLQRQELGVLATSVKED